MDKMARLVRVVEKVNEEELSMSGSGVLTNVDEYASDVLCGEKQLECLFDRIGSSTTSDIQLRSVSQLLFPHSKQQGGVYSP